MIFLKPKTPDQPKATETQHLWSTLQITAGLIVRIEKQSNSNETNTKAVHSYARPKKRRQKSTSGNGSWKTAMEGEDFAVGSSLLIKTTLGEEFEGQVLTFDRCSNILVLHILFSCRFSLCCLFLVSISLLIFVSSLCFGVKSWIFEFLNLVGYHKIARNRDLGRTLGC